MLAPPPAPLSPGRGALLLAWTLLQRSGRETLVVLFYLAALRFLEPSELGLAGMLQIVIFLLQTLGGRGLPAALLQQPRVEPPVWRASFWHLVYTHLLCALFAAATGAAAAMVWRQAAWLGYGACVAVIVALSGMHQIPQTYLQKNLQFDRLAARTLTGTLLAGSLCLALAWSGAGVWSLLAQGIAYEACNLVLAWKAARWRPGLPCTAPLEALLRYGRPLAWAQAAHQTATMAERGGVGLFQNLHAVGLFQFWRRLGNTYQIVCAQPLLDIAGATLPHLQHHPRRLLRSLARMLQLQSAVALPALGLAITLPLPLIHTLLGPQWEPAARYAPGFALSLMPSLLFFGPLFAGLRARGLSQPPASFQIRCLVLQTPLVIAASVAGLLPAVAVLAFFPWLAAPWAWRLCRRGLGLPLRPLLPTLFPAVVSCSTASLATLLLAALLPPLPPPVRLVFCGTLYTAIYTACLLFCTRRTLTALRRFHHSNSRH